MDINIGNISDLFKLPKPIQAKIILAMEERGVLPPQVAKLDPATRAAMERDAAKVPGVRVNFHEVPGVGLGMLIEGNAEELEHVHSKDCDHHPDNQAVTVGKMTDEEMLQFRVAQQRATEVTKLSRQLELAEKRHEMAMMEVGMAIAERLCIPDAGDVGIHGETLEIIVPKGVADKHGLPSINL